LHVQVELLRTLEHQAVAHLLHHDDVEVRLHAPDARNAGRIDVAVDRARWDLRPSRGRSRVVVGHGQEHLVRSLRTSLHHAPLGVGDVARRRVRVKERLHRPDVELTLPPGER
jgi:hypothetical protein